jgi:glycosyltransferase involved in cell wall biosynthesis
MNKKSFVIATPLFPPDIGGPAKHAQSVYSILQNEHVPARVVSFSGVRKFSPVIRHFFYTVILFVRSISANTILALDEFSVGLSAALVSLVLQKKLILRIGGDRLWEKAVQEGKFNEPLPHFCKEQIGKKLYPFTYYMVCFIMRRAEIIIFPSNFYRELAVRAYAIPLSKTMVIENENLSLPNLFSYNPKPLTFIYAGRFTKVKNLSRMISAFNSFAKKNPTAHLFLYGEGPEESALKKLSSSHITIAKPLSRKELLQTIANTHICVLPSLSEASPNFAFECSALGVPLVITRYVGGIENLENIFIIDPLSEASIKEGYERAVEAVPHTQEKKEENNAFETKWLSILYK